jgi:uncharacterized protein (DUF1810 family)
MENNLQKFLDAQQRDYSSALSEIINGKKRSHWMWYIFPQIQGLGHSQTAKFYAINDLNEAKDFLHHQVLGKRLIEICNVLYNLKSDDAHSIFGSPDDVKLRSSMTLFYSFKINPVFQKVLDIFFNGANDSKTLELIGKH